MELTLGINNLKIKTLIGVYPEEREALQELFIDLEVTLVNELKKDSIDSTLNYEMLVDICKNTAFEKKYFLIESFAKDIMDRCFEKLPVLHVKICVSKPGAIKDCAQAYVKLSKDRK